MFFSPLYCWNLFNRFSECLQTNFKVLSHWCGYSMNVHSEFSPFWLDNISQEFKYSLNHSAVFVYSLLFLMWQEAGGALGRSLVKVHILCFLVTISFSNLVRSLPCTDQFLFLHTCLLPDSGHSPPPQVLYLLCWTSTLTLGSRPPYAFPCSHYLLSWFH